MELIREHKAKTINIKRYYRLYDLSYGAKDRMIDNNKNNKYRDKLIESICKN